MNILLTGGTGFIGNTLSRKLIEAGHDLRILTRDKDVEPPFYHWNKESIDEKVFDDLDGIIHLAGAPLMKNWTKSYKKEIIDSRVNSANFLFNKVKEYQLDLKFFISASGSSYYGQQTSNKIFSENDDAGNDFLAEVCVAWENAAFQFEEIGAKVVCIRTPLVLAKHSDSFQLMKKPTQFGFGACLGKGSQWMTWVHLDDLCEIYAQAINNPKVIGAVNAIATEQTSHQNFMQQLAFNLKSKIYLPNIPEGLVKLGMGEKSTLILDGSRISNQKLLDAGFKFEYETLNKVFKEIL